MRYRELNARITQPIWGVHRMNSQERVLERHDFDYFQHAEVLIHFDLIINEGARLSLSSFIVFFQYLRSYLVLKDGRSDIGVNLLQNSKWVPLFFMH